MNFLIERENDYLRRLEKSGVGDNDSKSGATPTSYVSYLKSAAKILNCDISAQLFPNMTKDGFANVCQRVRNDKRYKQYADGTRRNAVSALLHYFNMCAEGKR